MACKGVVSLKRSLCFNVWSRFTPHDNTACFCLRKVNNTLLWIRFDDCPEKSTWEKYFRIFYWNDSKKVNYIGTKQNQLPLCEFFVTEPLWNEIIILNDQSSILHHVDYLTVQLNSNCCRYRLRDEKTAATPEINHNWF